MRRRIEVYMERNQASWYCKTRISVNRAEPSYCTEIFIENGRVCDTLRKEEAAQTFYERVVTVSSKVRGLY